jgi:hypothetical protein
MADLNALIAQGYQFQAPPDPFAQYAKMQQLNQGEQTNQLNRMKMQEYQRGIQEQNALRGVVSKSGFDPMNPTHQAEAYAAAPTLAPKYLESILTTKESAGKITAADIKAKTDKRALLGQAHRDISGNPSDAQITAHLEDVLASSIFSPTEKAMVQKSADDLLALPYEQRQMKLSMQGASAADLKPQVVGASSSVYNPTTGTFTQAPAAPEKSATPTELVKNYEYAKSQGFAGSLFDYERKLKEAGRAPAAPAQPVAPTITQIVDPANPNQMITIDARRYQGGGAGSPGVIGVAGKEPSAALRTNKAEAGKTQLADELDNLRASFQKLDEMRAVPSTERNVLSNIGSATAASGMGQMLGRATGTEAQAERDVINSARLRLVNSIKTATGMSAQQLNSNVELQTMLKSISDPGQSVQAAMRIIDDIEKAYVTGDGTLPKRGGSSSVSGKVTPAAPNLDALLKKYP